MLGLDFALMAVLLTGFFAAMAMGFELPETALADMELTPGLIALVILGAPLGEELVFRSWLSGRPGHVLAIIIAPLVFLGLVAAFGMNSNVPGDGMGKFGEALPWGVVGGVITAGAILWFMRGRPAMRWFAAVFPVIMPLSALAFASVHLFNYEAEASPLLWLFVLPQFILGLICAYVRVSFGLWATMLTHALHNGTIMAVVLAAGGAGLGT